jgi:hypothetical protein
MNYNKIKQLKEKVEIFEDVNFISVLSESELLLSNSKTGDIWEVGYSINNEGQLTLHGDTAIMVEEAEAPEENSFENLKQINEAILYAVADDNQEAFHEGLQILADNIAKKYKQFGKKNPLNESIEDAIVVSENYERLNGDTKEFAQEFESYWEDKVQETADKFKELFEHGFIFDESNNFKSGDIIDPEHLLISYSEDKSQYEEYMENAEYISEFYNALTEFGIPEQSLKDIMLNENNWETKLIKNLTHEKMNGLDININEAIKFAKKTAEELFESDSSVKIGSDSEVVPGSSSGENKSYFLKRGLYSGSSVYTSNDLEKLISDLSRATSTYISNGFSRSELSEVSQMKDTVDKMYRTNKISDEEVTNVITNFNSKFGMRKTSIYEPLNKYVGNVGA